MRISETATRLVVLGAVVALMAGGASAQITTLCTTLAGGNGQDGNMFDLTGIGSPVIITGFDQAFGSAGTGSIEIYTVTGGGSYVGNETNPAAWTLVGTASNIPATGPGTADPIPLNLSIVLNPGQTQGFYITTLGVGPNVDYTNGTTEGASFVSDPNIDFKEGKGLAYPFGGSTTLFTPRIWNGCIKYQLAQQFNDDLVVSAISAPTSSDPNSCMPQLSNAEQVTIQIFNLGFNAVPMGTAIPVAWQLDGGAQFAAEMTPPLAAPLMPLTSMSYTFTQTVDLSAPATYTLDAVVSLPGDGDASNDQKTTMVTSLPGPTPGALPFVENFDTFGATVNGSTVPPGWINDETDGTADWLFETDTPGSGNGPDFDHTTGVPGAGWYAFTEDSTSANAAINLLTPCISLAGTTAPMASFWINNNMTANTAQQNRVRVDVDVFGSGIVSDIVPALGHTNGQWEQFLVELDAFAGQIIRLQFRGQDDNNGNSTSINDVGLDDVSVFDFAPGIGQNPQPGLATLDVNACVEANGLPIGLSVNGPYFASATSGGTIDVAMGGAPNQPMILLLGTLSPNTFDFGLIGQLDVDNPGLSVLGDGTATGFFNSFFILDGVGLRTLSLPVDASLAGFVGSLQAIMFTGTPLAIAFSNAVEVSIL